MKFCDAHWAALRQAIDIRGLSHLVAKSGEVAAATLVGELTGRSVARELTGSALLEHAARHGVTAFDPLMSAHWGIFSNAIQSGGLYLLSGKPDGSPFCPLCELAEHGGNAQEWIDGAADESLRKAQQLSIVPVAGS